MILRQRHRDRIHTLLSRYPVVAILGARQVGKTTLARQIAEETAGPAAFFDLENPQDIARLREPMLALEPLRGLVVLDELQRITGLFETLRVLADRPEQPARFLVLGSASPELLRQSSESLAGRIFYHTLTGFSLDEIGPEHSETLWMRGGFPRSYLAGNDEESFEWRVGFIRTFLERDIPQLDLRIPSPTLHRFWSMVAHYHGQIWNSAELARAFGVAATTVRRYLDALTAALVLRQLLPWHANVGKRQVKAPKVYVADPGLLHALLNLSSGHEVMGHPKVGASWEGFVLQEVITRLGARPEECFFWATHAGAELDLLVIRGGQRLGFEFKHTAEPRTTRSMHTALADLHLDRLDVVHAGRHTFPLADRMRALSLSRLMVDLEPASLRPG